MSASETLVSVAAWADAVRDRGLLDEAAVQRLRTVLADSEGERLDKPGDPLLVIMLCGPTAVGKSSLINALAGADISRRGLGATTGAAVIYVHEQDDTARLHDYSSALDRVDGQKTATVRHRCDALLHKVLIDSPDIDSVMMHHRDLTARLVHAADIVLFVTSPEKYKVIGSALWVLQQRPQRAMAFVLNKWDRAALGVQAHRREEVEADFHAVLAAQGFPDAVVFKVSALGDSGGMENDLPGLRAWLEAGISQSTAATIRQRRLQAARGRLAEAIESATPPPLSAHPFLPEILARMTARGVAAGQSVAAESAMLDPAGIEDSVWPATPGLFGLWIRARFAMSGLLSRFRAMGDRGTEHFGNRCAGVLADEAAELAEDSALARLPLGTVPECWLAEVNRLRRQLAALPLNVESELLSKASRPGVRRYFGIAVIYAVELLIVTVLAAASVRIGIDFVYASSAPPASFATAMELVFMLMVAGHIAASMILPPLRRRLRRTVSQQARSLVKRAADGLAAILRDHVAAADALAAQGRDFVRIIDSAALTVEPAADAEADRLFGRPALTSDPVPLIASGSADVIRQPEPAQTRARFD